MFELLEYSGLTGRGPVCSLYALGRVSMQYRASKRRCQVTMERCKGATFLIHGLVMCQVHARDMYGDAAIDRLIRLKMVNWQPPKVTQIESFDWVNERDNNE